MTLFCGELGWQKHVYIEQAGKDVGGGRVSGAWLSWVGNRDYLYVFHP